VKNVLLVNAALTILFLSATYAGSTHHKRTNGTEYHQSPDNITKQARSQKSQKNAGCPIIYRRLISGAFTRTVKILERTISRTFTGCDVTMAVRSPPINRPRAPGILHRMKR
jgi:hypothetical protein